MATNLELQAELKKKNAYIDELETELKALKETPAEKPAVISKGLSGFVIKTSNKFNGLRAGVMFRDGVGILLDNPMANHTIQTMKDLGYEVTRSENLTGQPETAEQVGKTMIDILKS